MFSRTHETLLPADTMFWKLQASEEKHALKAYGSSVFHLSIIPMEHARMNDVINVEAYVMKKSLRGSWSESCLDVHRCWSVSPQILRSHVPAAREGHRTSYSLEKQHQRAWLIFSYHHGHHCDSYHLRRHWENIATAEFTRVKIKLCSFFLLCCARLRNDKYPRLENKSELLSI